MTALVLLPGMDGTDTLRGEFIAALTPTIEAIVVSYPADRALGYIELEAIARSKLPTNGPYVLLGESFSGPIAISIAAQHPPGLVGLVLCCSFASNPRPILSALGRPLLGIPVKRVPTGLVSHIALGPFATAAQRARLRAVLSDTPDAVLKARLRAVLGTDVSSRLSDIRIPVLYLRASRDRIVPRSCSDAIVRRAPQTRIVEIDAPHFLLQAAPGEAARAVEDFLEAPAPIPTQRT